MAIGSLELKQISIDGTIRLCLVRGRLEALTGLWAICTRARIIFLGSPFPYLPFDMHIGLVQNGTMAINSLELTQISIDGIKRRCLGRGNLEALTGLWAICTNA